VTLGGLSEEAAARFSTLFVGAAIGHHTAVMVRIDTTRAHLESQLVATDQIIHLLQNEWAGSIHRIHPWLSSGQAYFHAAKHVVGPRVLRHYRRLSIALIRDRWADLPHFSVIPVTDAQAWAETVQRFGVHRNRPVAYIYAFLAYEYLKERTSTKAVVDYFAPLQDKTPRDDAFRTAFGFSINDFDTKVRARIAALKALYR
jgi:hypothetical protein